MFLPIGNCPHLERIESAMRTNQIPIKPLSPGAIQANCRIHRSSLESHFGPLEPVVYLEYFIAERAPEDQPVAELLCRQCNWRIVVRHPSQCNLDTLWFPAAPPNLVAVADHRIDPALRVTAIACSPSGQFAAVASGIYNTPQSFSIWDLARREQVAELPPHGVIRNIAWSVDEQTLVTGRGILWTGGQGAQGPSLFVWNASNGTERLRFGNDLFGVRGMAVSPGGRSLLASGMLGKTGLEGSTLDLWDLASGQLLKRLAHVQLHGEAMAPVFEVALPHLSPTAHFGQIASRVPTASNRVRPPGRERPPTGGNSSRAVTIEVVRAWRVADGQGGLRQATRCSVLQRSQSQATERRCSSQGSASVSGACRKAHSSGISAPTTRTEWRQRRTADLSRAASATRWTITARMKKTALCRNLRRQHRRSS